MLPRRTFTGGIAAGFFASHGFGAKAAEGPADKLSIAVIGIGGQGEANLSGVSKQNIVALCDVDETRGAKGFERFPRARRFTDFRRMFDELDREIDAVVISTPDHTHFHPAWWAIERGKHVYLEKPLAHEVAEVRRLTDAARAKGLATQLGSQRHALAGLRAGVEIVKSGMLGTIKEVHSWIASKRGMPKPPGPPEPPPGNLDWDLWLGPVAERPYTKGFAPYDWRFWWEFGTGETGNWGCHILDIPYWALDLGHPVRVAGSGPDPDPDRTPTALTSRLDYPERTVADGRTLPPVSVHWYQCDKRPPFLDELGIDAAGPDGKRPSDGKNTLFIGSKGMLLCGFSGHVLLPADAFAGATVPQTIPPSPGFHAEWLAACRGGPPATCHFGYSGPMAESTLLANIAYRVQTEFAWDAAALTSGRADVDALLRREYRKGWEL
ncbi:MAG: gfo/Idh/MocA family oxidoreductase [Planctomycetia bacterium]|nr:gfo/Idh/MocA family oxidoreductase [Planctomycetia bacterium]